MLLPRLCSVTWRQGFSLEGGLLPEELPGEEEGEGFASILTNHTVAVYSIRFSSESLQSVC